MQARRQLSSEACHIEIMGGLKIRMIKTNDLWGKLSSAKWAKERGHWKQVLESNYVRNCVSNMKESKMFTIGYSGGSLFCFFCPH